MICLPYAGFFLQTRAKPWAALQTALSLINWLIEWPFVLPQLNGTSKPKQFELVLRCFQSWNKLCFTGHSKSLMIYKLRHWFKSFSDLAYWWSFIGEGLPLANYSLVLFLVTFPGFGGRWRLVDRFGRFHIWFAWFAWFTWFIWSSWTKTCLAPMPCMDKTIRFTFPAWSNSIFQNLCDCHSFLRTELPLQEWIAVNCR